MAAPIPWSSRKGQPDHALLLRADLGVAGTSVTAAATLTADYISASGDGLDRSDKPVAAPRQSLDKSRVVSRVVESLTEPFDGRVQAMFKVDEGVGGPEFPVKLFARNQLTGVFQKTDQNLDRLPFKPDFAALLLEFARTQSRARRPRIGSDAGMVPLVPLQLTIATLQSLTRI